MSKTANRTGSRVSGIALATLLAGPIFITCMALARLSAMLPDPIIVTGAGIITFVALLVPASMVGGFIAGLPSLVGTVALTAFAETRRWLRPAPVWMAIGGWLALALILIWWGNPIEPAAAFSLVVTSAICAGICQTFIRWDD